MEHIVTVIGYRERFLTKDQMDKLVNNLANKYLSTSILCQNMMFES